MELLAFAFMLVFSLTLPECPDSPNCVSSQAKNPNRRVEPLDYKGYELNEARQVLIEVLKAQPRTEITEQSDFHLKAEAKSNLFGFVDDLDFVFVEPNKLIQVRSASRTGYWDLGANARRIETIRQAFDKALRDLQRRAPTV